MNLGRIAKGTKGVKSSRKAIEAAKAAEKAAKLSKAIKNAKKLGKVVVGTRVLKKTAETESVLAKLKQLLKRSRKAHFDSTYKLKPNATYKVNGYTYKTDHLGRIKSAEGNLKLKNGTRNTTHQRKAGGADRLKTDDGGHLIGTRFDGSGKVDNIVPMNSNLNRGEFKKLENTWAKALKNGQKVDVKVTPVYKGDSLRPDKFKIKYTIDGKTTNTSLPNRPGGK